MVGTAHSAWGLWGAWRRGPDLVARVAQCVAAQTGRPAQVAIVVGGDKLEFTSEDDLEGALKPLKGFSVMTIESRGAGIHARVAFIRRAGEFSVGARKPRRARVRHGVLLEVTAKTSDAGTTVADAKEAIAAALERGRPRLTRPSVQLTAKRPDPAPGYSAERAGSASLALERYLRDWPGPSGFPLIFVLLSLLAYAGVVALLTIGDGLIFPDKALDLDRASVQVAVGVVGVVVGVAALIAQAVLFPPVEVATLTNARRVTKVLFSSITISSLAGVLVKIPWIQDLFS